VTVLNRRHRHGERHGEIGLPKRLTRYRDGDDAHDGELPAYSTCPLCLPPEMARFNHRETDPTLVLAFRYGFECDQSGAVLLASGRVTVVTSVTTLWKGVLDLWSDTRVFLVSMV
jgi:hypothetical protein